MAPHATTMLGSAESAGWCGAAVHYGFMPPGISDSVTMREDKPGIDATATLDYASEWGRFSSTAAPYALQGSAAVTAPGFRITGTTAFREEVFLETRNGMPAVLEFTFDLRVLITPGGNGRSFCRVSMWHPEDRGADHLRYIGGRVFFSTTRCRLGFSTEGSGWIGSRRYFPFALTVWTSCWTDRTGIHWNLDSGKSEDPFVRVCQRDEKGTKKRLQTGAFSLTSRSRSFPNPVPASGGVSNLRPFPGGSKPPQSPPALIPA